MILTTSNGSLQARFNREVIRLRGNRCESCGRLGGSTPQELLHAHHIKKRRTHPGLRFDEANVKVLCQECHEKEELLSA